MAHLYAESTHQQDSAEFSSGRSDGSHSIHYPPDNPARSLPSQFFHPSHSARRGDSSSVCETPTPLWNSSRCDSALILVASLSLSGAISPSAHLARRHQAPTGQLISDPEGPYLPLERADESSAGSSGSPNPPRLSRGLCQVAQDLRFEDDGTMGQFSGVAYGAESFVHWAPLFCFVSAAVCRGASDKRQEPIHWSLIFSTHGLQFSVLTGWRNERGWQPLDGSLCLCLPYPGSLAFDLLTQQYS